MFIQVTIDCTYNLSKKSRKTCGKLQELKENELESINSFECSLFSNGWELGSGLVINEDLEGFGV